MLQIIEATPAHYDAIWDIFHAVVKSGDTYVYSPETKKEDALKLWVNDQVKTFVAVNGETVVGTYIIRPNFPALGSHIANCSYMVSDKARGLGVGKALGEHSIQYAKDNSFIGMQFNIVVSTNTAAVRLWQSLGFDVIGTTPKGFLHKTLGHVDTFIMYKGLE
jgi:L-amino acid N-acyltransferase YncA